MHTYYVSMSADLLGVYIEYQAESERALRQYLERQYLHPSGAWKLPWCAVYRTLPPARYAPQIVVKAQCGTIHEEVTR